MLYVLDEPSIGLHPKDNIKMIRTLNRLRDIGNTVIDFEHDEKPIRSADHVVEMGPGPGVHGGEIVVQSRLDEIVRCNKSSTGQYLSGKRRIATPKPQDGRRANDKLLGNRGARENNLKSIDVDVPLSKFVCIAGASGSGKSKLVKEIIYKQLWCERVDPRTLSGKHDKLEGVEHNNRVVNIDQSPIGRNSRSNPATHIGFYDNIRSQFAPAPESKECGYKPGRFSFNVNGGRCEECQGEGVITTKLYFMPDVEATCSACKGARYNCDTLEVTYNGCTIYEVLEMSIEEGVTFFKDVSAISDKIAVLNDLGLGYVKLGQSSTTLSGGEAQRIKLAAELSKLSRRSHVLYIRDEPTTGLHRLADAGRSVLVIEHHLDVIKTADHVIDLGSKGGHGGGQVIANGTPEAIAQCKHSHTGRFLKAYL